MKNKDFMNWANSFSDEEVKKEYLKCIQDIINSEDSVYDAINSLDNCIIDKLNALAAICLTRNINIWE